MENLPDRSNSHKSEELGAESEGFSRNDYSIKLSRYGGCFDKEKNVQGAWKFSFESGALVGPVYAGLLRLTGDGTRIMYNYNQILPFLQTICLVIETR